VRMGNISVETARAASLDPDNFVRLLKSFAT
jgi:hypothetical protein